MSNSSIVTRCPQCHTAFRVTHAQLNVAKGAVRCGSCLGIFRALDHEVNEEAPKKQIAASRKNTNTQTKSASTPSNPALAASKSSSPTSAAKSKLSLEVDEELLQDNAAIDNDTEQESEEFYFYDKETPEVNKNTSIFGATKAKPVTKATQEKADESWALDMLAELEDDDELPALNFANRKAKKQAPENTADKKTELIKDNSPTEIETPKTAIKSKKPEKKTTNVETVIDADYNFDNADFIDSNEPVAATQDFTEHTDNFGDADDLEFYYDESFETSENDSYDYEEVLDNAEPTEDLESLISDEEIDKAMKSGPSYKQELQSMLKGIQSAPVEMSAYETEEKRKWLWRIGLVIASITLIAQIIFFRFDSLSKHPTYRPVMTQICSMVGCEIPELIALDQIRSNNLIVRTHPNAANTLLVDVILINNANFEQAYPALSLEFSTINDTLIAASLIQPEQYLQGELAGSRSMPIQQPIQVSLNIEDPGSDAVNYRLNIVPANP